MRHLSKSPTDTAEIARNFLHTLKAGDKACIVALQGDLGSGKTAFAQAAGEILGVEENMHSPTFVIMKIYKVDFNGFKNFIHIDAYRLEKDSELLHLGWEELIKEPENIILIEWPEHVPEVIPPWAQKISFSVKGESEREIIIHEKK